MSETNKAPKKPTIYDVAAEAGVSKSLVSLVMRDDPSVSEPRRDAVLAAIKKLNYRPSRYAQQLASHKTRSVGVLITDYKNLSFVNVLKGLREVLDDAGYQVIISDIHRSPNFSEDPVDAFVSMEVEGIVFIAEPAGLRTKNLNIPTVMIGGRETLIEGSDLVSSDDSEGTRLVLEHLAGLGHRNIAHLTGVGGIAANRRNSYVKQMKSRGFKPVVFGNSQPTTEIGGYLGAKELLASGEKFTAIYAANDYMAAGAISALKEQNLSVPKDVSVVGYDNAPISSDFVLKLSSVDDMGIAIGRNAATLILERANETKKAAPRVVLLKPDLVVRKSTKKI